MYTSILAREVQKLENGEPRKIHKHSVALIKPRSFN